MHHRVPVMTTFAGDRFDSFSIDRLITRAATGSGQCHPKGIQE